MSNLRSVLLAACLVSLPACRATPVRNAEVRPVEKADPVSQHTTVDRDTALVRSATAGFRDLKTAVAAGYPARVEHCVSHPSLGGMGFHHAKLSLMDDHIEVERPEILVYGRTRTGEYVLNGVEYVVPYTARSRDAVPPRVMGQALKRSDELKLWYLHVWIWNENPSGLFADWNPNVSCA